MFDEKDSYREGWYRPGPEPATPEQGNSGAVELDRRDEPRDVNSNPQPAEPGSSTHNPPPDPPAPLPLRGVNRVVVKAVTITVCIVVLIIASALVFTDGGSSAAISLPEFGSDNRLPASPDSAEDYGDYHDFFEDYFTGVSGTNNLPTVEADSGVAVELAATAERELSLQEVYDRCGEAVVGIKTKLGGEDFGWGSGVIFDSRGYIITNAHVIEGGDSATVTTWDGEEYEARSVGYDASTDLAVLKIEAENLTACAIGSSDALRVGDGVVAIGNPFGEEYRGTMTNGIISAINRDVESGGHTQTLLQTNAALNEGNSGGPLINMYGQVVGITNMKLVSFTSVSIEGIGFAIPSSTIEHVVNEILVNGYVTGRTAIGITVGGIPSDAMSYYDLPVGLYVEDVVEGSGAWAAGIQKGDIITAVCGELCTETAQVTAIKDTMQVGDFMTMTVWRDGATFDVEVELLDQGVVFGANHG